MENLPQSQSFIRKHKLAVIILILMVLLISLIIGITVLSRDNTSLPSPQSNSTSSQQGPSVAQDPTGWKNGCTNNQRVSMTNMPMNIDDVGTILPLGMVAGGHVTPIDHLYFSPAIFNSPRDQYPVFAMADGYIIEIGVRRNVVGSGEDQKPDYRIVMQHSCQTVSYFDLVTSLHPSILEQVPELKTRDFVGSIRIPITGGQEIGRIGGQTLDTAIYNLDLKLTGFITPELYEAEPWKIHTDDFFGYFRKEQADLMNNKNLRQAEPRSGKIDMDQPGKLIGNWFKEGTYGYSGNESGFATGGSYWKGHLHIGYDAILPDNIWVSVGDFNGDALHFYVTGNNPDPAQVTVQSGVVKYELIQPANFRSVSDVLNYRSARSRVLGVILVQVLDGEKLKVEVLPGKIGSQVSGFSGGEVIFER